MVFSKFNFIIKMPKWATKMLKLGCPYEKSNSAKKRLSRIHQIEQGQRISSPKVKAFQKLTPGSHGQNKAVINLYCKDFICHHRNCLLFIIESVYHCNCLLFIIESVFFMSKVLVCFRPRRNDLLTVDKNSNKSDYEQFTDLFQVVCQTIWLKVFFLGFKQDLFYFSK